MNYPAKRNKWYQHMIDTYNKLSDEKSIQYSEYLQIGLDALNGHDITNIDSETVFQWYEDIIDKYTKESFMFEVLFGNRLDKRRFDYKRKKTMQLEAKFLQDGMNAIKIMLNSAE